MNGAKILQKSAKRNLLGLSFERKDNGSLFLKFENSPCRLFLEGPQDEIIEK